MNSVWVDSTSLLTSSSLRKHGLLSTMAPYRKDPKDPWIHSPCMNTSRTFTLCLKFSRRGNLLSSGSLMLLTRSHIGITWMRRMAILRGYRLPTLRDTMTPSVIGLAFSISATLGMMAQQTDQGATTTARALHQGPQSTVLATTCPHSRARSLTCPHLTTRATTCPHPMAQIPTCPHLTTRRRAPGRRAPACMTILAHTCRHLMTPQWGRARPTASSLLLWTSVSQH